MKRNYGIDLLRILSMFMVVILHVLGQGGVLNALEPLSLKYWLVWVLKIVCYCAVDCFALISGFVMYRSKPRLSKAVSLWLQVVFYTVGALLAVAILRPQWVGLQAIADAIFPVVRGHYWYISAYFALLIFQPLLNLVLEHAEKRVLGTVLLAAFIMFCTLPNFVLSDPYMIVGGYSFAWVSMLYLAGGYVRKYEVAEKVKKSTAWAVVGSCLAVNLAFKVAIDYFPQNVFAAAKFESALINYTSPTMVLLSIALLIALSKQSFGKVSGKIISWCAPAALGVYLIHTNLLVWKHLLNNMFVGLVEYHWALMVLLILAAAIGIYVACTLVEKLRIWFFKLVKIDVLCEKAEKWAERLLNRFIPV